MLRSSFHHVNPEGSDTPSPSPHGLLEGTLSCSRHTAATPANCPDILSSDVSKISLRQGASSITPVREAAESGGRYPPGFVARALDLRAKNFRRPTNWEPLHPPILGICEQALSTASPAQAGVQSVRFALFVGGTGSPPSRGTRERSSRFQIRLHQQVILGLVPRIPVGSVKGLPAIPHTPNRDSRDKPENDLAWG